jgi:2-oxoglutarate ferredoxin oxidoreductase subunit gamma
VNSSVFHLAVDVPDAQVYAVPAMDMAVELGSAMSAGFVMLGAFAAITGLVGVDSAVGAMRELVPAYRSQHVVANERAIRAGADSVPQAAAPAWPDRAGV